MRTIALICLIAIFFTAFYGLWIFFISLYILVGIAWVKHEIDRPFPYAPIGRSTIAGILWIFLFWPIIVIYDCYESWQTIKKGKRFITHDGNCLREFPDWESALACAHKRAKETNEKEMISDQTIFVKQYGQTQFKSWFVHPDGNLQKLPRYFLAPKWLLFLRQIFLHN